MNELVIDIAQSCEAGMTLTLKRSSSVPSIAP